MINIFLGLVHPLYIKEHPQWFCIKKFEINIKNVSLKVGYLARGCKVMYKGGISSEPGPGGLAEPDF